MNKLVASVKLDRHLRHQTEAGHAVTTMSRIGTHLLADLYGVDLALLRDEGELVRVFRAALDGAGFSVLHQSATALPTADKA